MNIQIMTIINSGIKTIKYSIRRISEIGNENLVILLFDILRRVAIALLLIILPKKIIEYLLMQRFDDAIFVAITLCGAIFLSELCLVFINKKKKIFETDIKIIMSKQLSNSIMNCEYEKIERKSYLDNVEFGKKCIEQNSISKIYQYIIDVTSGIISLLGIFYIISNLKLWLIGLIVVCVLINAIGEVFRLHYVYTRERQGNEIERNLYYARNDLATNQYAKDIRLLNLYDYISNKVSHYAKELCNLWSKTSIKSVKILGWTYIVNGIQYVVIYSFLAYSCYINTLDVSEFVLYMTATIGFGEALKDIFNAFIGVGSEYKYIEGIINVAELSKQNYQDNETFAKFNKTIEFVNVWFKFPEADKFIIKQLNLIIEKDKTYAVVGKNGAGKTTLVKLLLGFYKPTKGKILIDGIPLEELEQESYRKIFSCVFQDYNVYGFSIRDNIAFLDRSDDNKVKMSIKKAGLEAKVLSLSNSVDTTLNREMNENAIALSGGQAQQLAIARALYREADVYILDEPTAALSPNSEFNLYQEFYKIAKKKTVIFISHRLASCILCDEVIVLDEGCVTEKGNHNILMKKKGLYAEMFNVQAKPYLE